MRERVQFRYRRNVEPCLEMNSCVSGASRDATPLFDVFICKYVQLLQISFQDSVDCEDKPDGGDEVVLVDP